MIREALEILDLRGTCIVKRGPGGGVIVSHPTVPTTARLIVSFLLRTDTRVRHVHEARAELNRLSHTQAALNPAMDLLRETLDQLDMAIPAQCLSQCHEGGALFETAVAQIAGFDCGSMSAIRGGSNAECPSSSRISTAQHVALTLSRDIADGKYPVGARLGSEWEVSNHFGVSRGSMRQATRLLETFGVAEIRPGRGNGLVVAAPEATHVIRAIISHLLAFRLAPEQWAEAMQLLGAAALTNACDKSAETGNPIDEVFVTGRKLLRIKTSDDWLWLARPWLRSVVGLSGNPIMSLFWRVTAGYTFRAFDAASDHATCGWQAIIDNVPDIIEAVLDRNSVNAINAYNRLFASQWLISFRIKPHVESMFGDPKITNMRTETSTVSREIAAATA
jgi:DNA-binding FadR family transcriptional regulator